jgi:hypothetical protein
MSNYKIYAETSIRSYRYSFNAESKDKAIRMFLAEKNKTLKFFTTIKAIKVKP